MSFELPSAFMEATLHVTKAGSKPDFLNERDERQFMLCSNGFNQVVSPQQHTSHRRIGNYVGGPENSHSTHSPGGSDWVNGVSRVRLVAAANRLRINTAGATAFDTYPFTPTDLEEDV